MRIAIIGAGNVAKALALGWTSQGHEISFGVREPRDPRHGTLRSGLVLTVAEASQSADLLVLATSWAGTKEAIVSAGDLTHKILIDCTNPFEKAYEGLRLAIGFDMSGGEMVAEWAPTASVFKAFNTTSAVMAALAAGGRFPVAPMMLVAGDDPAGKTVVLDLVGILGFEPLDAGPLRNARLLEPLAMLFIELAKRGQGREFAFGVLRR
jgi:8-hydroxy-5-deazaflavin:NADPH oxidoreductase